MSSEASLALPSPDGLWRGTYRCERAVGSFGSETPEFTINLEMRLANGLGAWKSTVVSPTNGSTLEINISVGLNDVGVDRIFFQPVGSSAQNLACPDSTRATSSGRPAGGRILVGANAH